MRYFFVLMVALFLSSALSTSNAQINLNFNMDTQPAWGPTGYDYVENYYLPDPDIYYNVPQHRYYYYNNGRWRYSSNLPSKYRSYNFYNTYKVVVNEKDPWKHHNKYRDEYKKYKGQHSQEPIRDSRDAKYLRNKYHPEHNNWVKQQKHDNGNHYGNNKKNNKQKRDKK
ncbi:MAG TPA: hypothetical protein VJ954_01515 [Ignavibacteriaceae bacterium]|nr:hypothetical protein [Ignavibacteriaceae bacterium]